MKHYIAGSTKLPAGMDKYYRYATIKTLANELIELSEAEDYISGMEEICEENGVEFIGLAIAKDEYEDELTELGDDIVTIIKDGKDLKLVVYRDNRLQDVSGEVKRSIKSSYQIRRRYIAASEIIPNKRIQEGLSWDYNGHNFTVTRMINSWNCEVTETWISEDSGRELSDTKIWQISSAPGDGQYIYLDGSSLTFYATGADNYPWDDYFESDKYSDEYDDEDEYYTPSATAGDYSPSAPWNAPGLSESDFI